MTIEQLYNKHQYIMRKLANKTKTKKTLDIEVEMKKMNTAVTQYLVAELLVGKSWDELMKIWGGMINEGQKKIIEQEVRKIKLEQLNKNGSGDQI